jgi:actin-related protein
MFPGYASRLYNEMEDLYEEKTLKIKPAKSDNGEKTSKKNKVINIIDSARRKYSVFIGATVLAQTYNCEKGENTGYWITKQDWEEVGPTIVLKKCQNIMA